jgi:hypothetical protein
VQVVLALTLVGLVATGAGAEVSFSTVPAGSWIAFQWSDGIDLIRADGADGTRYSRPSASSVRWSVASSQAIAEATWPRSIW